jgi:hypothetical protein
LDMCGVVGLRARRRALGQGRARGASAAHFAAVRV